MNELFQEKTAFFTPDGKKHFLVMPMDATNANPAFMAVVTCLEILWNKLYDQRAKHQEAENWAQLQKGKMPRQQPTYRKQYRKQGNCYTNKKHQNQNQDQPS
jgi:hypothetical protein